MLSELCFSGVLYHNCFSSQNEQIAKEESAPTNFKVKVSEYYQQSGSHDSSGQIFTLSVSSGPLTVPTVKYGRTQRSSIQSSKVGRLFCESLPYNTFRSVNPLRCNSSCFSICSRPLITTLNIHVCADTPGELRLHRPRAQ